MFVTLDVSQAEKVEKSNVVSLNILDISVTELTSHLFRVNALSKFAFKVAVTPSIKPDKSVTPVMFQPNIGLLPSKLLPFNIFFNVREG